MADVLSAHDSDIQDVHDDAHDEAHSGLDTVRELRDPAAGDVEEGNEELGYLEQHPQLPPPPNPESLRLTFLGFLNQSMKCSPLFCPLLFLAMEHKLAKLAQTVVSKPYSDAIAWWERIFPGKYRSWLLDLSEHLPTSMEEFARLCDHGFNTLILTDSSLGFCSHIASHHQERIIGAARLDGLISLGMSQFLMGSALPEAAQPNCVSSHHVTDATAEHDTERTMRSVPAPMETLGYSVDQSLIDVARGLVEPFGRTLEPAPSTLYDAVAKELTRIGIPSSSELLRTAAAQVIARAGRDNAFLRAQRRNFLTGTGFNFESYQPGPTITGSPVDAAVIASVLHEMNIRLVVGDVSCHPPAVHVYLPIGTDSCLVPKLIASDVDDNVVFVVRFGPTLRWLSARPIAQNSAHSGSGSSDSTGSTDSESDSDSESGSSDSESDSTDSGSESRAGPLGIHAAEIEIGDIGIGDIIDPRSPELPETLESHLDFGANAPEIARRNMRAHTTRLRSSVATEEHESRRPVARRSRNSRSATGEAKLVLRLQAALARAKAALAALSASPDRRNTFERKCARLSFSYGRCRVSHCTTIDVSSSESSSRSFTDGELLLKRYSFLFLFVFVESVRLGASSFVEAWPYGQYLPLLDIEGELDSGDGFAVLAAFAGQIANSLSPLNLTLHRGPTAAVGVQDDARDSGSSSGSGSDSDSSSDSDSNPNPGPFADAHPANSANPTYPATESGVRIPHNPRSVTMHQRVREKLCGLMLDLANFTGTIKPMRLVTYEHHLNRTVFSFERISTGRVTSTDDTNLFSGRDGSSLHRLAALLHKCSSADPADLNGTRLVLSAAKWNKMLPAFPIDENQLSADSIHDLARLMADRISKGAILVKRAVYYPPGTRAPKNTTVDAACIVCGSTKCGDEPSPMTMLLCDNDECNAGCHLKCFDPPITAVPHNNWLCDRCKPNEYEDRRNERLAENQERLRALGIDDANARWHETRKTLVAHVAKYGSAALSPHKRKMLIKKSLLGKWVNSQVEAHANGSLSSERTSLLESIPGWSWDTDADGQAPLRAPPCTATDDPDHVDANLRLCEDLPLWAGVRRMSVRPDLAEGMAAFLWDQWVPTGHLVLPASNSTSRRTMTLHGYVTYPLTALPHDGVLQRRHTLMLATKPRLDACRAHLPSFAAIECAALAHLCDLHEGCTFRLSSAHVLLQSKETLRTTVFTSHQDTENDKNVTDTLVIKLTADTAGEPASAMRVVGAGQLFFYGPEAGSAAVFDARLYHISEPPESDRAHLKLTLFFKPDSPASRMRRLFVANT
jgi:hypothetical protein